jgi:RNA polymerase sigma-70 factor (ECF subfamily)
MSDETDEQLMHAYREGNARAFELLLARHERKVWNFLRRSVGDATLAEDLLQEVFLRVIKARLDSVDWKGEAKFTTWVYAIARNLCVDHARRAVHRDARSLDAPTRLNVEDGVGETLHDRLATAARDAEGLASDGQVRARVDAAVAALPPDQREVFLLREVMDMPFAEIAVVVGAPEPTVKSRMRYALERLREALDDLRAGAAPRRRAGGSPAGGTP